MTIQTDYYGAVEYEEADLVVFEDGLFGFHNLTCYLPLCLNEDEDTMILLVSVEKPEVAFVLINPLILCPDYSPNLSPEELSCLGVSDSGELSYYAICVVKRDYLENTVNLKCPLAINLIQGRDFRLYLNIPPMDSGIPSAHFHLLQRQFQQKRGGVNMLILRRKKDESLLIGGDIRITVVDCGSDGVRLAIDAPKHISILREELSEAELANQNALAPDTDSVRFLQSLLCATADTAEKNRYASSFWYICLYLSGR